MVEAPTLARSPWAIGASLAETVHGPVTRSTLALFAGASNDHVALHIDSDFAKAAGLDDVITHGMLTLAYLAQALEQWARPENLRGWTIRFTAIVPVNAAISCRGEVIDIFEHDGERCARLRVGAWTDAGAQAIGGEAVVAIDLSGE